ncbi:hypothetical protein M758_UG278800 [Ceratodon purpureus]|nr:hypothetical protein M758_UG278800 [Ceratodon purpureus]
MQTAIRGRLDSSVQGDCCIRRHYIWRIIEVLVSSTVKIWHFHESSHARCITKRITTTVFEIGLSFSIG